MRYRYGNTRPVESAAVASATVIETGDLVATPSNSVPIPAASQAWNTDLATTQTNFVTSFLGVSLDRSRNGDESPITVATGGVFEFNATSATYHA